MRSDPAKKSFLAKSDPIPALALTQYVTLNSLLKITELLSLLIYKMNIICCKVDERIKWLSVHTDQAFIKNKLFLLSSSSLFLVSLLFKGTLPSTWQGLKKYHFLYPFLRCIGSLSYIGTTT